jgi:hypothetical protein
VRRLKDESVGRKATEVGPGDYVKVGQTWMKIEENTAHGASPPDSYVMPRTWTVKAENGQSYSPFEIGRYAKAEDIEDR